MELSIKFAWASLALLHVMPGMSVFVPGLVDRLYGSSADGDVGVLLVHRGALLLTVCIAALFAAIDPSSRRLASLVVIVSMISFLVIYSPARMPAGELQKIAIANAEGSFHSPGRPSTHGAS